MDPDPVVVTPDRAVGELLLLMNGRRIGSVLVAAPDGRLLGIFTERDLLRRVADAVPGWRNYPVSDWMTRDPHAVGPDLGWEEAVNVMTRLGVRRLPVVEGGRVLGLLSTRMLMSRRAEFLNQQVEARTAELRQANDQLLARDQEVLYNLRAAGKLQRKLLPHAPPDWAEVKWGVHFAPLDYLGGDYYDFATPTPDHLGFLIADASGHSVAAAMVAVLTRFAFAEASRGTTSPGAVLAELNQRLQGITEERFVTAFYGVFDRRSRVLRYASAGHPHPLRWEAATGRVKPLAAHGFLLGVIPDEVYAEKEIALAPGDALCFFTDGLVEARNEIGELFGEERVTECIRHASAAGEDLLTHLLECQRRFSSGVPLSDDVTLAVCRLPTG
jgi:serine phosphatase RsbU (regulator of sigma subunit)